MFVYLYVTTMVKEEEDAMKGKHERRRREGREGEMMK